MKKKWNIGWGVVSKCNMACEFCYSKKKRENSEDVGYSDWIKFIDENHMEINSINYGTGENTMDDDWFRLIAYIRGNYPTIRQSLTTNGYLSEQVKRDSKKEEIVSISIDEIDISLDFYNPVKHNKLRGQPKAFDWALETLKFCKEKNITSTIVFLGSKRTLSEENIDGIFRIAKTYGALIRMNVYRPTSGIDEKAKAFIASFDDITNAIHHISKNYKVLAINDSLFASILTDGLVQLDPSGSTSLRVLSDGSITPSTYLVSDKYLVGNIKEKKVLENLDSNISKIVNSDWPDECSDCTYRERCNGGVLDRRYLWYNTLKERDPYCPFSLGKPEVLGKVNLADEHFESVHDGYLPTMFFKN